MSAPSYMSRVAIGSWRIVQHSKTNYLYVAWYNPETRQVSRQSLRTLDLGPACALLQSLLDRGIEGDPRPYLKTGAPPTLRDVLEQHRPRIAILASREAEGIHISRLLASTLVDRTVTSLVPDDWAIVRDAWLADGVSIATVSRRLSTARSALRHAFVNRKVSVEVKVPEYRTKSHLRSAPPKGSILEPKLLAALYDQLTQPHLQLWMALMLGTGARTAAVLELEGNQIDLAEQRIHLNPKGRLQTTKFRPVLPIHAHLLPWMSQAPRGRLIRWNGSPVASVKTARRAAVIAAGLPVSVNGYSVRHSVGRFMRKSGVGTEEIGVWLGHLAPPEGSETTLIYSPYEPAYLSNALSAIEKLVEEIASYATMPLLEPPLGVQLMLRRLREADSNNE